MDTFCILFTDTYDKDESTLTELSQHRTLASVPFGGRYRLIDFMLSSLVGAKVTNIGIITKSKYGSLIDHLGWGKDWDLDRKNGGLKILTPFATASSSSGDNQFEILKSVNAYIESVNKEYVIIANANMVANIDFNELLSFHKNSSADITVLATERTADDTDPELTLDKNQRVLNAIIKSSPDKDIKLIAEDIFVMRKSMLCELVDLGATYGWRTIKKDILAKKFSHLNIYAYIHSGYFKRIEDLSVYLSSNMDMLKKEIKDEIFKKEQPILTRTKDSVPTKYGDNAYVKNSFVADGCLIDGKVESSVIFRNVRIEAGAEIKNSVIMQNSRIESNVSLNNAVVDKNAIVTPYKKLHGEKALPIVVKKGKIV